jgi:hypothetical protein
MIRHVWKQLLDRRLLTVLLPVNRDDTCCRVPQADSPRSRLPVEKWQAVDWLVFGKSNVPRHTANGLPLLSIKATRPDSVSNPLKRLDVERTTVRYNYGLDAQVKRLYKYDKRDL